MKRRHDQRQPYRDKALETPPLANDGEGLRVTLNDLPCAHDTLLDEVARLRRENRILHNRLEAALVKIAELSRPDGWAKVRAVWSSSDKAVRGFPRGARRIGTRGRAYNGSDTHGATGTVTPAPRWRGQQPKPGHGRRRHSDIPTRHVYIEVPEVDQCCPRCEEDSSRENSRV